MKKGFLIIVLLVLWPNNITLAQTYDMSQVAQAKLVSEWNEDCTDADFVTFGSYEQRYIKEANLKSNQSVWGMEDSNWYLGGHTYGEEVRPIEWRVLDRKDGKVLLISDAVIDVAPMAKGEYCNWETSNLRQYLNDNFYNKAFTDSEKEMILTTVVKMDHNGMYENNRFGSNEGNDTNDKLFCLSYDELIYYFNLPDKIEYDYEGTGPFNWYYNEECIKCGSSVYFWLDRWQDHWGDFNWWLRTMGKNQGEFLTVRQDGGFELLPADKTHYRGIRPAMWVSYAGGGTSLSDGTAKVVLNKSQNITDNSFNKNERKVEFKNMIEALVSAMENCNYDDENYFDSIPKDLYNIDLQILENAGLTGEDFYKIGSTMLNISNKKENIKAIDYLNKAYELGYNESLNTLACIYWHGWLGVKVDHPKAISLWEQGAALGVESAKHNLKGKFITYS